MFEVRDVMEHRIFALLLKLLKIFPVAEICGLSFPYFRFSHQPLSSGTYSVFCGKHLLFWYWMFKNNMNI